MRATRPSVRASRRARDNLFHLLSTASINKSPPLIEAIVFHLSSTTRIRATKRAGLESLLLPDGLEPLPDDTKDLLYIACYNDHFLVTCGG